MCSIADYFGYIVNRYSGDLKFSEVAKTQFLEQCDDNDTKVLVMCDQHAWYDPIILSHVIMVEIVKKLGSIVSGSGRGRPIVVYFESRFKNFIETRIDEGYTIPYINIDAYKLHHMTEITNRDEWSTTKRITELKNLLSEDFEEYSYRNGGYLTAEEMDRRFPIKEAEKA